MTSHRPGPSRSAYRLVSTLLALLVLANLGIGLWYLNRPRLVKPTHLDRQNARTELFGHIRPDSNAIIFLGDSHTEYFPVHDLFPGLPVVNRGVGASTTAQVRARAMISCGPAPAMILVQAGINDLFQGRSVDEFDASITALMDTLRTVFPQARMVVQSLIPTKDVNMDDDVRRCNELLNDIAQRHGLPYVDLYAPFANGQVIADRYTYDGVHLTAAGYLIWADLLRPLMPPRHDTAPTPAEAGRKPSS